MPTHAHGLTCKHNSLDIKKNYSNVQISGWCGRIDLHCIIPGNFKPWVGRNQSIIGSCSAGIGCGLGFPIFCGVSLLSFRLLPCSCPVGTLQCALQVRTPVALSRHPSATWGDLRRCDDSAPPSNAYHYGHHTERSSRGHDPILQIVSLRVGCHSCSLVQVQSLGSDCT